MVGWTRERKMGREENGDIGNIEITGVITTI